ncbi:MAG: hypothetical protein ACFB2W_21855 [Leptolyngbyaceae cyanobacterium]
MSSVLPIDTQRYQSGDYILEVTAHRSALSQWSDRPVVRQLRFSLWLEQQRLATGDQLQLVTIGDTIESYVQRHLSLQAWPQTHRLKLLDQAVELSTLQLFDLAEVLNSYGQRHITLPTAPARRRRRWWTGSAVASLLVAVGVTTVYLQYRPEAFNQVETSQAPSAVFEDDVAAPEVEQEILTEDRDAAPSAQPSAPVPEVSGEGAAPDIRPETRSESQLSPSSPTPEASSPAPETARSVPPSADLTEPGAAAPRSEAPTEAPTAQDIAPSDEAPIENTRLSEAPPAPAASAPEAAELAETDMSTADSAEAEKFETAARVGQPETDCSEMLAAIATQLAPYQPTEVSYPLVYHLQLAPNGTITAVEPIDNAPALELPDQIAAPGRSLQIELIYTGNEQPTVRELL